MLLIATCIGLVSIGALSGRHLTLGAAIAFSSASLAMVVVQAHAGRRLRNGPIAVGWLLALGFLLGLGLGRILAHYASANPTSTAKVAGVTALLTAGVGLFDVFVSHEFPGWLDALVFLAFSGVVLCEVLALFGTEGNPLPSLAAGLAATVSIVAALKHVQRHAFERDAVSLATGVVVLLPTLLAKTPKLVVRR